MVPEVTIPPEVTPENVTMHIMDSSARPEHREQLEAEIRKAHVICIVYAIDDPNTFNRLPLYWLPYIRSLGVNVPSILVGNKIDLRGDDVTNQSLEDEVIPIMNEFKEVETCVECSSKQLLNVSEVFYFAQKAVLHPTAPLYDSREHVLKPQCVDALRRIFKLCDSDKDNVLNDIELNEFQRKCFNTPLQQHELDGVKDVVREHEPAGVNENGLTEVGFAFLHSLFIQKGRLETTWTVLRKFGYGDDLSLREDFLLPPFEVPPECSVELSPHGYQFLTELFQAFDKDKDGALNISELNELLSTSPGNPWENTAFPHTTITTETGSVTLQGWLAQWSMTTLSNHQTALKYLAYLGYEGDTRTALKVTRPRKVDRKKGKIQRNVFLCYVVGAPGSGKTSLMKAFVQKPFSEVYEPTQEPFNVVNSVEMKGVEKYLVLEEVGAQREAEILSSKKRLEACDLLCFVYDTSDVNSFEYLANLREKYKLDHVPVVFVATKCELDLVTQRYEVQPDIYCRQLKLAVPLNVSVKEHQMADLYHILTGVAMNPSIATPGSLKQKNEEAWLPRHYITLSLVAGAVILTSLAGYKLLKQHTNTFGPQHVASAASKKRDYL
ncbi:EF hand associated-domain-containing protein [Halteromyces radiatus]|uniref:EF hand associated-domain-containing protein n=1 Tax=Halteromyces radiatus TaxID=101107 RepID=UPI00221EABDA|nr:EF hand associated-domain-containing protein [Halteromyces radiatus]KAI8093282.1 EF hand associated-domain-containing protein [Halteromyces radiatus]